MSKSNQKHLEKIQNAIKTSDMKDEHKSLAVQKVEEWYAEDKADHILIDELMKISAKFEPILKEIGFL
jgi:hypothetical protein